jgi:hypothetical protein
LNSPNFLIKVFGTKYKDVDPEYVKLCLDDSYEKLSDIMQTLGLEFREGSITVHCDRVLANNTKSNYIKQMKLFALFASMIGDVESLIMLHPNAPSVFVPSMSPTSIGLFMKYKTGKNKGNILQNIEKTANIKDVFGTEIICNGTWNDPGIADQFLSSIGSVHKVHSQTGEFTDSCNLCKEINGNDPNSMGCRFHQPARRVYRMGNPRSSEIISNATKQLTQDLNNHRKEGAAQLLPVEIQAVRRALCSSGILQDLQTTVMFLTSIFLCDRFDEFASIEMTDFISNLSIMIGGILNGPCVVV